jgi:hypothetical protein
MSAYLASGKNKQNISALVKYIINSKDNCTIYKIKGICIHMKDIYTVKKEYTDLDDSFHTLKFNFNNYFCENKLSQTFDNKYYYVWLQTKDIEKFVERVPFSDIERYIYMIGYTKTLQMYETLTNKKIEFDLLKTDDGLKKLFAGILSGIITMKDDIDIKVVEVKTLTNVANNEKIYIIDGNIYNKDGAKSEWILN